MVAPLTNGVWRTDTLPCVGVTVIPHMAALAGCAAALLEVKESSCTTVAFGSGDARLAPTLTGFVTVKRLGTKRVAVTRDTRSACADAVSLRPCPRPVRAPGTTPCAGGPPPSLLHGLYGNTLHWPAGLPPLVTLATQVTASAHKAGATDAAALDVTALRHRAVGAAATGNTVLTLSIPPTVGHALITLSSNHVLLALTPSGLLVADLRYRAIRMALTSLAVFSCDGISVVTISANFTRRAAITLATAQTLACDWITAARYG